MKLFERRDALEGAALTKDVIFVFGRKLRYDSNREKVTKNGWYFKFEFPFVFERELMDHNTFLMRKFKCRWVFYFMRRTLVNSCKKVNFQISMMVPLDASNDPVVESPQSLS